MWNFSHHFNGGRVSRACGVTPVGSLDLSMGRAVLFPRFLLFQGSGQSSGQEGSP